MCGVATLNPEHNLTTGLSGWDGPAGYRAAMTASPLILYHDLITVPCAGNSTGIYWLRLFRKDGEYVAVVTEVPGNPDFPSVNGTPLLGGAILDKIQDLEGRRIQAPELRLYQIFPEQSSLVELRAYRVFLSPDGADSDPAWLPIERREIEQYLGITLPPLPAHDELYRDVRALGGGNYHQVYRDVFEAMPVDDLAPFVGTHRCNSSGSATPMAQLTAADARGCTYHQANWRRIADESVRIITELGQQPASAYERAARASDLPEDDCRWLVSLFSWPIKIGQATLSNGLHRSCALRLSGAAKAAVVVRQDPVDRYLSDWHYLGDG